MQTLREGDGQSYFYVLWPEDRAAESSVRSQGAMPQLFQKVDGMLPASPGSPAQEDDGLPDNSTSNGHSSSNGNARCRSREDETARAATGKLCYIDLYSYTHSTSTAVGAVIQLHA